MSIEKGSKYIYAQEYKLYYSYYYFGGHWEDKNWRKMKTKQSEEYFFHLNSKEKKENGNKHCNVFSVLIGCLWLHRMFILYSDFSLAYFSG